MEVYDANQQKIGVNNVRINYKPLTLLRAEQTVEIEGVINRKYTFNRYRNGNRHTFEGPEVFGNSIDYGRVWQLLEPLIKARNPAKRSESFEREDSA